jgi:Fuc2NAc and GlcNAc transferase
MSIVVTFIAYLTALWHQDRAQLGLLMALVGAGGWVAIIGFLDDHRHIPAIWRLVAHLLGGLWALYWLSDIPVIAGLPVWVGGVLACLYIVGLLNFYNFMDGIDGIAAIEAITTCLGALSLYLFTMPDNAHWTVPALLLAATLGFLFWNYPHARIFMGDGASGFLGLTFAVLSIEAALIDTKLFWAWLILLGVFVVDATVTLCRRLVRGDPIYKAHRLHAYQHASRRFGSHAKVSTTVAVINLAWLWPIAFAVGTGVLSGPIGLAVAYAPLAVLAVVFKAGARDVRDAVM